MTVRLTLGVTSALLLTACVNAADCDPNRVNNVLTSGACSGAGQFDARIQNLERNNATISAEVERERIAISEANVEIRGLQAQQRISAAQLSSINGEIAALQRDINALSRTSANSPQAAALRQQIATRKAAVNSFANAVVL